MARSGLGAPARPQFPPLGAGGGACVLPSPPAGLPGAAHPARDGGGREAFLEKLRAHLSGTGPARPDTTPPPPGGIRRAARAFPAPPTGRKEARAGGALEAGSPHSPLAGPQLAAQALATRMLESRTASPAGALRDRSRGRAHHHDPTNPLPGPQASAGRTRRPGRGAAHNWAGRYSRDALRLRHGSTRASPSLAAPGPCPETCAPTWAGSPGSSAAEQGLMLRREVAASPAAGGGCTGTRRGGGGARRPGPCARWPGRGCHLEARRRSRGTTGGGSGGDGSSST